MSREYQPASFKAESVPPASKAGLPKTKCPSCRYEMDSATCVEEEAEPSPGDFSVCLNCGKWLIFTDILTLRVPTDAELTSLDSVSYSTLKRTSELIAKRGPLPQKL